jgi:hypothetical protein
MEEVYSVLIGSGAVILGFFIGKILAKFTKDEIKKGKFWFGIMTFIFGLGAVVSLVLRNDAFFFSFLFFMAVIGGSLKAEPLHGSAPPRSESLHGSAPPRSKPSASRKRSSKR